MGSGCCFKPKKNSNINDYYLCFSYFLTLKDEESNSWNKETRGKTELKMIPCSHFFQKKKQESHQSCKKQQKHLEFPVALEN